MVLLLDMISSLLLGAAEVNSKTPTEAYPERINIIKEISHLAGHSQILIADTVGSLMRQKERILPTTLTVMLSFKRHTAPIREKKQTFD